MKKILFIVLLFLNSCAGNGGLRYYEEYRNNQLSKKQITTSIDYNNKELKKYCVYSLSYFLPINFWNVKFNDKGYIEKTIKYFNKKGVKGSNMINIYVSDESVGTPLFSYYCVKIIGDIVE